MPKFSDIKKVARSLKEFATKAGTRRDVFVDKAVSLGGYVVIAAWNSPKGEKKRADNGQPGSTLFTIQFPDESTCILGATALQNIADAQSEGKVVWADPCEYQEDDGPTVQIPAAILELSFNSTVNSRLNAAYYNAQK